MGYDNDIDTMPQKSEEEEEVKLYNQPWSYYTHPDRATKLLTKRFCTYFVYVLIYYLIQVTCCIALVNFYGDADRFIPCN